VKRPDLPIGLCHHLHDKIGDDKKKQLTSHLLGLRHAWRLLLITSAFLWFIMKRLSKWSVTSVDVEHPDLPNAEWVMCIERSRRLPRGKKTEIVVLYNDWWHSLQGKRLAPRRGKHSYLYRTHPYDGLFDEKIEELASTARADKIRQALLMNIKGQ
jgi:hypothetical protein